MSKKEDIHRIQEFIEKTKNKNYEKKEDFNLLFEEVRNFIFKFILYYDGKRTIKKYQAIGFRFTIATITGLGIIFPVLGSFFDSFLYVNKENFAQAGHSLLIIAASLYGIKNYYGSTNGHIRYSMTQLKLEKLIAVYSIKLSELLANAQETLTEKEKKEFYKLLAQLLNDVFKDVLNETDQWSKDIKEDEKSFAAQYFKAIMKEEKKRKNKKEKKKQQTEDK